MERQRWEKKKKKNFGRRRGQWDILWINLKHHVDGRSREKSAGDKRI
jgi:hypothetical protein